MNHLNSANIKLNEFVILVGYVETTSTIILVLVIVRTLALQAYVPDKKYAGTEVKYEGEDLIIVSQSDILAIVE